MKALTRSVLLIVCCALPPRAEAQSAPNLSYQALLQQYHNGRTDSAFVQALTHKARQEEDWVTYARLKDEQIKRYPPTAGGGLSGDAWRLNGEAWDVFQHCRDTTVLARALAWSELSLQLEPDEFPVTDTKANLLYKLGRVEEAIVAEQKAIEQWIAIAKKLGLDKNSQFDDLTATLGKMKRGEPTWPLIGPP